MTLKHNLKTFEDYINQTVKLSAKGQLTDWNRIRHLKRMVQDWKKELEQLKHEDSETIDYLWTDINYKKYIKIDEVLG